MNKVPKQKETGVFAKRPDIDAFLHQLGWYIEDTGFNPKVLEPLLRHLILINAGTGYHTIKIVIRDHKLDIIKGADTEYVNLPITIDKEPKVE